MAVTDFIHVFGSRIPVGRSGSNSFSNDVFGGQAKTALRGNTHHAHDEPAWDFEFDTTIVDDTEAFSLMGLISGDWTHFPYNADFWGSNGAVHHPTYTASIVSSTYANITTLTYEENAVLMYPPWSVTALVNPGSGWVRHTVRSDGAKWLGAVRDDSLSTTWLTITDGAMVLTSQNVDDLVAFRFLLDEKHLFGIHRWQNAGGVWTKNLKVEGKFFDEGEKETVGRAVRMEAQNHYTKSAVSFSLDLIR